MVALNVASSTYHTGRARTLESFWTLLFALGVRAEPTTTTINAAAAARDKEGETSGPFTVKLVLAERNDAQRLAFIHRVKTPGTNAASVRQFQFSSSASVAADTKFSAKQQAAAPADRPDARFLQLLAITAGLGGRIQGFL